MAESKICFILCLLLCSIADAHKERNGCGDLHEKASDDDKCDYVKSHGGCRSTGYIFYLGLLYCNLSRPIGYILLLPWLTLLFYLLGDTAANYFRPSLEGLSRVLKLSPTLAGVTLLSFANGAPDIFSALASFLAGDLDDVGFNTILGGALFVSIFVVGTISLSVAKYRRYINCFDFVRDVLSLLLSLVILLAIVIFGKINLWVALCFCSLYFVYVLVVYVSRLCKSPNWEDGDVPRTTDELMLPLLCPAREDEQERFGFSWILELPLSLPRRVTIPVISEDRWSKPFAVMSMAVSPFLLAAILSSGTHKWMVIVYSRACLVGVVPGVVAFFTTESSHPPTRFRIIWFASGFLMSIAWTYILAQELVSLLVALGLVFGIDPSILGLTVLAWGNSLGDLVTNLAMATTGGSEGTQMAMAGCYAGPLFNTLIGLGSVLLLSSASVSPSSYVLPKDEFIYETLGFLIGGLLFALMILLKKKMRLGRFLGAGLIAIYLCFLFMRSANASGLLAF